MRTCKVCKKPIEHLHGNSEKCIECQRVTKKPVSTYHEPTMNMTITEFRKLQRGYDMSKALTLASTLHLATCYKADKWLVRVNKHNVELLHWYEKEVAKK